jgi:hypothetical protein
MRYTMLAAAVLGLLGLGVFTPQRERRNASDQEGLFVVRVPHDFPTIQQAIDAVAEGGTVLIGPGLYKENVQITKSIRMIGAGQELVQIQSNGHKSVTINIEAEKPLQVYLTDLTVNNQEFSEFFKEPAGIKVTGDVQVTVERVTITSCFIGILLQRSWAILSNVTVSLAHFGIFGVSSNFVLKASTIKENQIGIGVAMKANFSIEDSIIKDNAIGVAAVLSWGGGAFDMVHTLLSGNELAAVVAIGSLHGALEAAWSENEIIKNGVGIYIGYDYYHENLSELNKPITRLIHMYRNRVIGNSSYGLVLERRECQDAVLENILRELSQSRLPLLSWGEASLEGTAFMGSHNEIKDNGRADFCPPDYPWPPGFRR